MGFLSEEKRVIGSVHCGCWAVGATIYAWALLPMCITNQVMDKSGFSTTLDRDGYNPAVMSWGRSRGDDRQGLGGNT